MKYIADAAEAKEIDRISIQEIGIPSVVLMEKASMAVAGIVLANINPELDRILVICGMGNNGGDGVAAARLLWESGCSVSVLLLGQKETCSEEMQLQLQIAKRLGMAIMQDDFSDEDLIMTSCERDDRIQTYTEKKLLEYNIIIDAIFGIGLCREVTGHFAHWIHRMNALSAKVFSVDIPSGIDATTGVVLGVAVKADLTITFGLNKMGLVLYPGTQYAGQVIVADIGFPAMAVQSVQPRAYTYDPAEITGLLPTRQGRSNKGSYGRVLVIAGSPEMSGAAYLAAEAAYRMGSGLVHVLTARENGRILRTKLPEAIVTTWSKGFSEEEQGEIQSLIASATAIVIGPGLGQSVEANWLLQTVIESQLSGKADRKPIVIDADGLNVLARRLDYFETDADGRRRICLPEQFILTPHLKEMSRLTGIDVNEIASHMTDTIMQSSSGCTVVLKDARTLVSDGKSLYLNLTGNNALATGGSGDVLSGMIGGLLAQGMEPMEAAAVAVFLHGLAADEYVRKGSPYTMLASDIIKELPKIMHKGEERQDGGKR